MAYKFQSNTSYLMPTNFGPVRGQRVAHYGDLTQLAILYLTEKDALAALLPEPFEPADDPVVTVYCQLCRDVDFMAGRGYNIVGVNLAAVFNGKKDHLVGSYAVALWENDTFPILLGREMLGAPKLYAGIPNPRRKGNSWIFHCSEYGTRLIEGQIKNAIPLDDAARQQVEQIVRDNVWMGWKYIPKADWSGPEVSFPTVIPSKPTVSEAWLGEGSHTFFDAAWESAPTSAHVMQGLRTLVVKEYRAAVITKGTNDLLTADSRRLE
jgi:acetoacetate decarboxylase